MKIINIIGAAIVLLANIFVSFNHSLELFRLGGFGGSLAIIGVVGAEVAFLLGVLNMTVSKLRGIPPGLPAYIGFLLGVSLILWSNIRAGLMAGITGIVLGAYTPMSLIVAEMILGRAILQQSPEVSKVEYEIPKELQGDTLLETALELYRRDGKIPSRNSLMQETKATEWQARKVIENLKDMV